MTPVFNQSLYAKLSVANTWTAGQNFTTGTTTISTADINGGAIDGTVIGGTTPAAVSCTTLTASGLATLGTQTGTNANKVMIVGDVTSAASPQHVIVGIPNTPGNRSGVSFAAINGSLVNQGSVAAFAAEIVSGTAYPNIVGRLDIIAQNSLSSATIASFSATIATIYGSAPGTPSAGQVLIGGGDIKAAGGLTIGGNLTATGSDFTISTNTSDGSDNKRIFIAAGGAVAASRGAAFQMYGNEYAGLGGNMYFDAGEAGSIFFRYGAGNSTGFSVNASGVTAFPNTADGAVTFAGKITAKVAVPGSFADLAAVRSYLASILT